MILTGNLYLNFQKISVFGVFGCFSYVLALGEGVFWLLFICFGVRRGGFWLLFICFGVMNGSFWLLFICFGVRRGVFGCFSYVLALGEGFLGQDVLNLLCFSMKSVFFAKF